MIFFVTTRANDHAMAWYLLREGNEFAGVIAPINYDDLLAAPALPHATYCFADLELVDDETLDQATAVWERLEARGCRLLNHPTRTLRRYDLLRALHDRGINRFAVARADDSASLRFPAFVRQENDHQGRRSNLVANRKQLRRTVARLRRRGMPIRHSIAVEFCDTADTAGIYRKYAAFVVGDAVIARHVMFSTDWQVKEADLLTDELLQEELEYVDGNPHEGQVREICALAHVDYGRVDYSLLDGELQVWEINTNPTMVMPTYDPSRPRAAVRDRFVARLRSAWLAIDQQA